MRDALGTICGDDDDSGHLDVSPDPSPVEPADFASPVADSPLARWQARLGHPIVIRIPRGYAVLLVVAVFAMILLAYWAGVSRAVRIAAAPGSAQMTVTAHAPPPQGAGSAPAPQRIAGRSYLLLTSFPKVPDDAPGQRREADRLVRFLRECRVAATVENLNNGGFEVVDLYGFNESQLGGTDYRDYVSALRRLGREWKKTHNGTRDFSSLRPLKFPF